MVHSQFTGFKILSVTISNPPDYLAHAPIIDSLTFVMLSHTTTRPTLARSLHQQVLINSSTPSTLALSDSLPQPSTTPTAFGSSVVVGDFEGYLHWFDPATGELQTRVRAGSDRITTAPLVVSDTLYVVTDGGKLIAFRGVVPKRES